MIVCRIRINIKIQFLCELISNASWNKWWRVLTENNQTAVNITRQQFEEQRQGRKFRISFTRGEIIDRISETYADVTEGEKLALFNSAGYLEIAINKGNAAGLFGLKGFSEKLRQAQLSYQTVRVYFS